MAVSKRLRFEILRRDNHTCRYCGASAPDVKLTVDHVAPIALGGGDEPSNLTTACWDCNAGKSSATPDQQVVAAVSDDAILWSMAMTEVARLRRSELNERERIKDWFLYIWNEHGNYQDVDINFGDSVMKFLEAGMSEDEVELMVEITMGMDIIHDEHKWKYFCGCCHTRIKQNAEMAAKLVNEWRS